MSEAIALKEQGNADFKAGQFAAAVDAYTRSLELDATQHLCLSNRSAAYLKLGGAAEQALADAERCVELAPSFAKGSSRQAAALQELRRWDDAIKACDLGIEATSDEVLRKMRLEVRVRQFEDRLSGTWYGKVSQELGGYEQEMTFMEGRKVRIEVIGRSIIGSYWLDCEHDPHHMNIQVPMPDAPPGMPPPPAVPYIVKIDDQGLHLCCPYMVLDRPTIFAGEGYCLMARGKQSSDDADELSKLSEAERLLFCAKVLTEALPDSALEEPRQGESEEVTREKLMKQVRFETSIFAVQNKFGEETMKQVLGAAKHEGDVPTALAGTPELRQLTEKLKISGLFEDPSASPPPPVAQARKAADPPAATKSQPLVVDPTAPEASGDDDLSNLVGAAVLVVGALALAVGAFVLQRRKASST